MGSFWGHIDEGIFFIVISIWWLWNFSTQYIMCRAAGQVFYPRLSYTNQCGRRQAPIESIFKILFPVVGFMAEVIEAKASFRDSDGAFRNLSNLQHMTIYGIFVIHGVVDLLDWLKFPLVKGAPYVTGAIAFSLYGMLFYYHANMHGKEPLERVVHILPIPLTFATAASLLWELRHPTSTWAAFIRVYTVLNLGTWFSHVAFILYRSDKFPGSESSDWDRSDHRNVAFAEASLGMHLNLNLAFLIVSFAAVYLYLKMKKGVDWSKIQREDIHYTRLDTTADEVKPTETKDFSFSDV